MAHRVALLAIDAVVALDLSIAAHVFGHPDQDRYELALCAAAPGPVATSTGFPIVAPHGLHALARADTVIVPGFERAAVIGDATVDALRAADERGARMVSICTGAFALAAAGVLDGRRATTHWAWCDALARAHPAVDVQGDVLYVDEGRVLTSAGVAAGIDLCLHIVRKDHGARVANAVARAIVVAPHRDGGQAQFAAQPVPDAPDEGLARTCAWAVERLAQPLTVAEMARHACRSERSFARHFRAQTGTSPHRWLLAQRVLHARGLLETTDLPVEEVARRCGFGTAASLRVHLRRAAHTTPTAYRAAWSGSPADARH